MTTARCRREACRRPLRSPESIGRGYGPVCWGREHPSAPSGPVPAEHPVDPNQIALPLEVSTVDVETRKAAIDTVARHALCRNLDHAVSAGVVDWGDYPWLSETDWDAVLARVSAIAQSLAPSEEEHQAAYQHLAANCSVQEGKPR